MSSKASTIVPSNFNYLPFESKSYHVQGGSGGYGSSAGMLHQDVFNMHSSDAVVPIYGSHELSDAESEKFSPVSGSGERKRSLQSRDVPKVSRHSLSQSSPRNALNSASTEKSQLHQHRSRWDADEVTDSDLEDSDGRRDHRSSYKRSKVDSKHKTLRSVSGSGRHNAYRPYESSESDEADSQSSDSESQSEDLSSNSDSETDEPSDHLPKPVSHLPSGTNLTTSESTLALKRVVYFRANSRLTEEAFAELKQNLQAYLPNTKVMLETVTNLKTMYSDRKVLSDLMSKIMNGEISEVLVADSNHLCNTKDGFNVFSWVCQQYGTKVFILPTLQSL
jgi:hypothetical protein